MTTGAARADARVDVVVVGGGHCGLAMSRALSRRAIDHVVLERGEVGEAWRRERWDSLRLLTPNWMTSLPGCDYEGDDPDGYMPATEVAAFLARYADRIAAPVRGGTSVLRVTAAGAGYRVETTRGTWQCRALVVATGAASRPAIPACARDLAPGILQLSAHGYRRPDALPDGGVLVVGASSSGLQIAQELQRSGRPVTIAVGEHVRMPRLYRGRDVQWWLLATGVLDQRLEDVDDIARVRRLPSPQLAGTPERATLDLDVLQREGVVPVGRLAQVRDGRALFSGSLRNACALADLKLNRMLDGFDAWARRTGLEARLPPAERAPATRLPATPLLAMDLRQQVRTVLWATGVQPDHRWLGLPVFDRAGALRHQGGVVDAPGLYVLGLPFLRRRKSSFIHGVGDDVHEIVGHLAGHLNRMARSAWAGPAVHATHTETDTDRDAGQAAA